MSTVVVCSFQVDTLAREKLVSNDILNVMTYWACQDIFATQNASMINGFNGSISRTLTQFLDWQPLYKLAGLGYTWWLAHWQFQIEWKTVVVVVLRLNSQFKPIPTFSLRICLQYYQIRDKFDRIKSLCCVFSVEPFRTTCIIEIHEQSSSKPDVQGTHYS